LAKQQFCSKSQVAVCVKLFQLFKVDNFYLVSMLGVSLLLFKILNFPRAAMFIFAKLYGKL